MEQNEKYGIVLVAETSYFKRGLKELLNYTKAFGQGMKESFVEQSKQMADEFKNQFAKLNINKVIEKNGKTFKVEIDPELDIDKLREASENYEKLIEQLKQRKSTATTEEAITYDKDIEMYEVKLQAINDRIKEIVNSDEELNEELQKTSKTTKNINLEGLFDRSIGKIKRFTFYLLGARSVFSLFMKYQSIYYQYNEQMQYQSELSQNAIALSLAPAFEFLGNVMTYASIAFAKFIELLTGVNVLSKVSTKGIRDYNKSLKETQTLVSGIDEITNLTNPQNLGLAGQYKALADFQKKIAEVEKFFSENKWIKDLAEGLQELWNYLKLVYDYIKSHWDVYKYIFGGVALALLSQNFTFGITVIGLSSFIAFVKAIEDYNKAKNEYDKNHQDTHNLILNNFEGMTTNFLKDTKEHFKNLKKGTNDWHSVVKDVKRTLPSVLNEIRNGELTYEEYKPVIQEWIGALEELDGETFKPEIEFLTKLNGSKDDISLIKAYFSTNNPNVRLSSSSAGGNGGFGGGTSGSRELNYNVNVETNKAKEQFANLGKSGVNSVQTIIDKINILTKKTYKLKIGAEIIANVGTSATAGANALSQAVLKAIRGYAKGLDYVPYDNYPALLHKGEAVVPAKYNPTIHSEGNEYTNSLLETLISKVDDLANRPNEFNIDGQKLAKATYPLIRAEARNYTYNEGVSR